MLADAGCVFTGRQQGCDEVGGLCKTRKAIRGAHRAWVWASGMMGLHWAELRRKQAEPVGGGEVAQKVVRSCNACLGS